MNRISADRLQRRRRRRHRHRRLRHRARRLGWRARRPSHQQGGPVRRQVELPPHAQRGPWGYGVSGDLILNGVAHVAKP